MAYTKRRLIETYQLLGLSTFNPIYLEPRFYDRSNPAFELIACRSFSRSVCSLAYRGNCVMDQYWRQNPANFATTKVL